MKNPEDLAYIDSAIDEIISAVGMNKKPEESIVFLDFRKANINKCIEYVANYLSLPIKVNLSYVPSDGPDGFGKQDQPNTDNDQTGARRIAAQVSIPSNLPLYRSPQFTGFPINVKVTDNCFDYPETFISIMAHELSHIVLHSLWHREKNSEIYTDLTAMVLGFSDIMKKGRKNYSVRQKDNFTETSTCTYGYLSDKQFSFACQKINKLLAEYNSMEDRCKSEYLKCCELADACKKQSEKLFTLLQLIDKKQNKRMKHEDTLIVIKLHEPGYIEKINSGVSTTEKQLKEIDRVSGNINCYNSKTLIALNDSLNQVRHISNKLNDTLDQIKENIMVLEKYQGMFFKIQKRILKEDSNL